MDVRSVSTIYRWEKGASFPDDEKLGLFCETFNVDPETFVVMKKKITKFARRCNGFALPADLLIEALIS